MRKLGLLSAALLFGGLAWLGVPPAARAADHGDAPNVDNDSGADIADVFLFLDPTDNTKVCILGTVHGFIVPGEAANFAAFDPNVKYRFDIENTGDAKADAFIERHLLRADRSRPTRRPRRSACPTGRRVHRPDDAADPGRHRQPADGDQQRRERRRLLRRRGGRPVLLRHPRVPAVRRVGQGRHRPTRPSSSAAATRSPGTTCWGSRCRCPIDADPRQGRPTTRSASSSSPSAARSRPGKDRRRQVGGQVPPDRPDGQPGRQRRSHPVRQEERL